MSAGDPRINLSPSGLTSLEQEVAVHLDTLRQLGPEYTDSTAKALVDQLSPLIDARVQQALAGRGGKADVIGERRRMVAMILGISIPLLAIAGGTAGAVGVGFVAVAMFIIVVVAMTHDF